MVRQRPQKAPLAKLRTLLGVSPWSLAFFQEIYINITTLLPSASTNALILNRQRAALPRHRP